MSWEQEFDRKIEALLPDLEVAREEPMSRHTTFRIGGPAKRMAFPKNGEQLVLLVSLARSCGGRPLVIGNGSNLLAPDEGLDRVVICTAGLLNSIELGQEENTIRAGSGALLGRVAEFACARGLRGLEFAHGIPGSVGGGVCMNAGAYGGELRQVLQGASVLFPDEGVRFMSREDLSLSYRHSVLLEHPEAVVLHGVFQLEPGDPAEIRAQMRDLMARRREKQPLEYPSAGSFFKRPEGHFAGALIEQCGLKGFSVGGAQVSEKHAGFLINRGGATCREMLELMERVQERVQAKTGVRLEPEVRILGREA